MPWRSLEGIENMSQEDRPAPPPPPYSGSEVLFAEKPIVVGVLLGIFIMFIGQMVNVYARTTDVSQASYVLMHFGAMLSSGALTAGGLKHKDFDKFVRLGMLLAAGLIISSMLGLTFR